MSTSDWERPNGVRIPTRTPRWSFGARLVTRHDFVGVVDCIYVDYYAARGSNAVGQGWFEAQDLPPSTKNQIFYSLVGDNNSGAVLSGEQDIREAP